ncbi:MAG: serine dehydratase [bacterium TMED80]|nr:MAG: serine dehydratase [bacterium TMED80]RZP24262.1 MAG: pyridoxal-phosphate dependent enzyme [bacterium]|tara:strand:+ start:660 stop:1598 length:939 start_codon:yes stop_codon:yes gene_type:complete
MVTYNDIEKAHQIISDHIHNTPILTSDSLDNELGSNLFFKCENFQKTGSFKIRGATNSILQLNDTEIKNGIITTSSGNHGAAVAFIADKIGTSSKIIMPNNTPKNKIENVQRYGGEIFYCEPNIKSREDTLEKMVQKSGGSIIHPYNDEKIIAGQGTAAKELIEKVPDLDAIICPVSGGGLLSGTLLAAKNLKPGIKVFGAEPENADDTYRSILNNKIMSNETTDTIADGLRAQVGTVTFPIIKENVDKILLVSEEMIISSMYMIWQRLKIIIEPSCSIVLAALMLNSNKFLNKKVGLILTGGNYDLKQIPW